MGEFDFAIEATDNRVILIEAKTSPKLSMAQVSEIMDKAHFYSEAYPDRKTALLLVSRYPLSAGSRAMFSPRANSAFVVVRGRDDVDQLRNAINRLLSGLES